MPLDLPPTTNPSADAANPAPQSSPRRNLFTMTPREGEGALQLAFEFLGVGIFGLIFIAIGLMPLVDGRVLGNATFSHIAGAVVCLLGVLLVGLGIRGVLAAALLALRHRRERRHPPTSNIPPHNTLPPERNTPSSE